MSVIGVRGGALHLQAACTWFLLAGVGCGDDAGQGGPAVGVNDQASAALTQQVDFADGKVRDGSLPKTTADDVTVGDENGTYALKPDAPADILALEVDNPDGDDPVAATLLQFEGDDEHHVEVPTEVAGAGTGIAIPFSVGADACADLCNQVYTLTLIETVRLESGAVGTFTRVVVELDCRDDGDPTRCPAGMAPSEEESLADAYVGAFQAYEAAVCGCFQRGGLVPVEANCDGFFGIDGACLGGVIEAHASEIDAAVECERSQLRQLATCFDGTTCEDEAALPCGVGSSGDPMLGAEDACGTVITPGGPRPADQVLPATVRDELDACVPNSDAPAP